MKLNELQQNWENYSKTDPLFALIPYPEKKGNKWTKDEFFKRGEIEANALFKYVESSLGIEIERNKALDFGCGVGRVTQALANYFDGVVGVDITPSLINYAKEYNRYGDKCKYILNETNNLNIFEDDSFDFIYTIATCLEKICHLHF